MPDVGKVPETHIATDRIILKARAELVKRLKSHQENTSDEYNSIMEMIHGELGDAILISQTRLQELEANNLAFHYFCLFYWHTIYEVSACLIACCIGQPSQLSQNCRL